jgi:oleate hydratase
VQVFWGYGLHPAAKGNYIQKPMSECSGADIMSELLAHLRFPLQPTLEHSITIPVLMPYITAQFLTRGKGDRPAVVPQGSTNLGFLGQFVEIEEDVVFTVEYSVRGAQEAVCGLMALKKRPTAMYHGERHPVVMAKAMKAMLEDGTKWGKGAEGKDGELGLVSFR